MHTDAAPRRRIAARWWAMLALAWLALPASAGPTVLRFVTKQFPPYAYHDANGQAAGPMVELLQAVCARAQWQCQVDVLPWRRAYQRIEAGDADGIFPFVNTADRQGRYAMSPDVVHGRYVLMARGCPTGCDERQHIHAGTIAAFGPSEASRTLMRVIAQHPGSQAQIEADPGAVLRKLLAGRYGTDGLGLVNEAVARWQLSGMPPGTVQTVAVVREFNYGFALLRRPGHEALSRQMAEAIDALCRSGDMARQLQRHDLQAAPCRPMASPAQLPARSAAPP